MRKHLLFFLTACILMPVIFASCSTNKQAGHKNVVVHKSPYGPKFMDSVRMAGRSRNVSVTNAMAQHKTPMRTATVAKVQPVNSTATKDTVSVKPPERLVYVNESFAKDSLLVTQRNPGAIKEPVAVNQPVAAAKVVQPEVKEVNPAPVQEEEHAASNGQETIPEEPADPMISKYAGMMSVDMKELNNYPLYHFIDEWYGTEYKWGGNDISGIDCSGFSQKLYSNIFGVDLERTVRQQRRNCDRIHDESEVKQGDLVFFKIRRFRVSHVGIYLANGYFVHASSSHGVVISNMGEHYWQRRFAGYGRMEKEDGPSESEFAP